MRSLALFWFFGVAALAWGGCGSDTGAGPARPGSGGAGGSGGEEDSGYEITADPGTCQKLCCSAVDCGAGEHCQALDATLGTLGTCAPGEPAEPPTGTPGEFPESCWTKNDAECNPLSNESCDAGDACDVGGLGDPTIAPLLGCFGGDNTQGPTEICDNAEGPFCQPGYHCVPEWAAGS